MGQKDPAGAARLLRLLFLQGLGFGTVVLAAASPWLCLVSAASSLVSVTSRCISSSRWICTGQIGPLTQEGR
jgi:hypothetical protein